MSIILQTVDTSIQAVPLFDNDVVMGMIGTVSWAEIEAHLIKCMEKCAETGPRWTSVVAINTKHIPGCCCATCLEFCGRNPCMNSAPYPPSPSLVYANSEIFANKTKKEFKPSPLSRSWVIEDDEVVEINPKGQQVHEEEEKKVEVKKEVHGWAEGDKDFLDLLNSVMDEAEKNGDSLFSQIDIIPITTISKKRSAEEADLDTEEINYPNKKVCTL